MEEPVAEKTKAGPETGTRLADPPDFWGRTLVQRTQVCKHRHPGCLYASGNPEFENENERAAAFDRHGSGPQRGLARSRCRSRSRLHARLGMGTTSTRSVSSNAAI